jgi:hypothetical protein
MAKIIVKPDNFVKESKMILADTGQELLDRVIAAYHLENVPSTLEVQIWSSAFGVGGSNRYRLDQVEKFNIPDFLLGYVRIASRPTRLPTAPDEEYRASLSASQ